MPFLTLNNNLKILETDLLGFTTSLGFKPTKINPPGGGWFVARVSFLWVSW